MTSALPGAPAPFHNICANPETAAFSKRYRKTDNLHKGALPSLEGVIVEGRPHDISHFICRFMLVIQEPMR
jgi:hypothetical protein